MSLTGLSLGGVLASKNRFRFTRHWQLIMQILNDVLAYISLNDVVALETYLLKLEDGSYLTPTYETVTTTPGETTQHDILLTSP